MRKPFEGNYKLTQGFNDPCCRDSYAVFGLKGHNGLDYGLPLGTPVRAPHGGKVVEATFDRSGYGNYVKIENDNEGSVLAHLESFGVQVGEDVFESQVIGMSGNTGNSTGPHLHWGYYLKPRDRANGFAGFIDQLPFIAPKPEPIPLDSDHQRGYKFLEEYRKVRRDGPEGNFEGYVRAIVGRDERWSQIMGEYSMCMDANDRANDLGEDLTAKLIDLQRAYDTLKSAPLSLANQSLRDLLGEVIKRFLG